LIRYKACQSTACHHGEAWHETGSMRPFSSNTLKVSKSLQIFPESLFYEVSMDHDMTEWLPFRIPGVKRNFWLHAMCACTE